ncbi:FAD-dependent oxidoreductase [Streptomyces sp. NPDC090021]|uniref:FAD-dependent oxidoreductase n=1 Tax=Streptomyces sp. NPDC090021 TaxID=3365919 RepID=UPI0037F507E6
MTDPPWVQWAGHTVVLGAVLGLLFGGGRQSNGSAFSVGLLVGLLDWVTWTLTLAPVLEGDTLSWSIAVAVARFPELVGAALFGAITGLVFHTLSTWLPPRPAPQRAKPRVVIVGGGFGGVGAARELDRRIGRGLDAHVTLISDSNFLLFTPLLVGVASSTVEARHVSAPVRIGLDHASFLHGRVASIDTQERSAYVSAGKEGEPRPVQDRSRSAWLGAEDKLAQMDRRSPGGTVINLGMPRIAAAQPIRKEGTASLRQSLDDQQ